MKTIAKIDEDGIVTEILNFEGQIVPENYSLVENYVESLDIYLQPKVCEKTNCIIETATKEEILEEINNSESKLRTVFMVSKKRKKSKVNLHMKSLIKRHLGLDFELMLEILNFDNWKESRKLVGLANIKKRKDELYEMIDSCEDFESLEELDPDIYEEFNIFIPLS